MITLDDDSTLDSDLIIPCLRTQAGHLIGCGRRRKAVPLEPCRQPPAGKHPTKEFLPPERWRRTLT